MSRCTHRNYVCDARLRASFGGLGSSWVGLGTQIVEQDCHINFAVFFWFSVDKVIGIEPKYWRSLGQK